MNTKKIIFHHIRNSTSKIIYNGVTILVDPFLAPKSYYPGFGSAPTLEQKKKRVPLVELPMSREEVVKNVQAVIITHTHYDHWDEWAAKTISKQTPIFVQNASDKELILNQGFKDIRVVGVNTHFKGITITRTPAQHGCDEMMCIPSWAEGCNDCMGFVLKSPGQKTIYVAGDTVWNEYIEATLKKQRPEIIIVNGALTRYEGFKGSSMMGPDDVKRIYEMCKNAIIIPVHMDSYAHCAYTTKTMKKFVDDNKLQDRVIVPVDGDKFEL